MAALAATSAVSRNVAAPCRSQRPLTSSFTQRVSLARPATCIRSFRGHGVVRAAVAEMEVETLDAPPAESFLDTVAPEPSYKGPSFLTDFVDSAKSMVNDAVEAVTDAAEDMVESAQDMVETVKESGQSLVDKAASSPATSPPSAEPAVEGSGAVESFSVEAQAPSAFDADVIQSPGLTLEGGASEGGLPDVGGGPELKVPEFKVPDFKSFSVPEFKKPDFALPDFKAPELPSFEKPSFELPKLPTFELPSLPLPQIEKGTRISLPTEVTAPFKAILGQATATLEEKSAVVAAFVVEKGGLLYAQLKEQVPAEYQPYIGKVESNLESAWGAAQVLSLQASEKLGAVSTDAVRSAFTAAGYEVDDSIINVVLGFLGGTFVFIVYYRAVYGGYSGDLTPEDSLKMLKESNAILLDLRKEEVRTAEGIPDLRRGARFKDRSLTFQKYTGNLRYQLRSPDNVDLQLFAATLKGLKGVSTGSSIIVMDASGTSQGKDIARGLCRYGFERSYILEGGFNAWVNSGLNVKPNEPEPLADILQNEFEAFVEEVKPTPEGVLTVLLGAGLGVYALVEWERSLQIFTLLLVAQIVYSRAKTYETSADLQRDIRIVSAPFVVVATVLGWVLKAVGVDSSSSTPKLATVPETPSASEDAPSTPPALPPAADTDTAPAALASASAAEATTSSSSSSSSEGSESSNGSSGSAPVLELAAAPQELELPAAPEELELPAAPEEPALPPPAPEASAAPAEEEAAPEAAPVPPTSNGSQVGEPEVSPAAAANKSSE